MRSTRDRRIASLRNMTEANGCTSHEAAIAREKLAQLESQESGEYSADSAEYVLFKMLNSIGIAKGYSVQDWINMNPDELINMLVSGLE